jgi:hypothetical protein
VSCRMCLYGEHEDPCELHVCSECYDPVTDYPNDPDRGGNPPEPDDDEEGL